MNMGKVWEVLEEEVLMNAESKKEDQLLPPRNLTVPGSFGSVKEAVEDLGGEQELLIKAGDHRWDGYLQLDCWDGNKTLHVRGEEGTRLLGRWVMTAHDGGEYVAENQDDDLFGDWKKKRRKDDVDDHDDDHGAGHGVGPTFTSGSFTGVTCAYATDDYEGEKHSEEQPHAVMTLISGPWDFAACELRAASADVLCFARTSQARITRCSIGGMGPPWMQNGTMSAVTGVDCLDWSRVSLSASAVEMCGLWGGGALRASDKAVVALKGCSVLSSMVGVCVCDESETRIEGCTFRDNQMSHLHSLSSLSFQVELYLVDCQFWEGEGEEQGRQWHQDSRPGTFGVLFRKLPASVPTHIHAYILISASFPPSAR
jgi:hypothetical protein